MEQFDKSLRICVVEPDARAQASLAMVQNAGVQFRHLSPDGLASSFAALRAADAVVVAVDTPHGLDLVARLCARPDRPPVIAVGGKGHHGKSLEHVLLQAELRGASATLVKPFTPQELAAVAFSVCNLRPDPDRAGRPAPLAGGMHRPDWPAV